MKKPQKKINVAIVGMGISGLKTAHSLMQHSPQLFSSITFYEKNSQLGGVLTHTTENHFLCEHGAQGVLLSRAAFQQTVQELNLHDKLLSPQKNHKTRYLIHNSKCLPLSKNIFLLIRKKLLNVSSFFKIMNIFIFQKRPFPHFNETLYDFVARILGKKVADNFLIPFCFGIWAGGAKKLVCRFCLSQFPKLKFKKNQPGFVSFKEGMSVLPKSLYSHLEKVCQQASVQLIVKLNTNVTSIEQINNGLIINNESIFDIVIYAGQPWRENSISFGKSEKHLEAFAVLKQIPTHSIVVVGVGGKKIPSFLYKEGFGALANNQSQDLLGILFIHSMFEKHVPKNSFLYRLMFGGDRYPHIEELSDDDLLTRAKNHLKNLDLMCGEEKFSFEKVVRWENYIPLATEHQDKVLCALWQLEALNPGLFFAGNYIKGVAVADCLEQGQLTAMKVIRFIEEQS